MYHILDPKSVGFSNIPIFFLSKIHIFLSFRTSEKNELIQVQEAVAYYTDRCQRGRANKINYSGFTMWWK